MSSIDPDLQLQTRPFTVGVLIGISVIAIFTIFHILRIVLKKIMKWLTKSNEIAMEQAVIAIPREDGRKLSSSCVNKLYNVMEKDIRISKINQTQFHIEKSEKFRSKQYERRTQSHRMRRKSSESVNKKKFTQTLRPIRAKNCDTTFLAGFSHRYIQDV